MQASRTESFSLAGAAVAGTLTGVALLVPAFWSIGIAAAASGFWAASAINHARGKRRSATPDNAPALAEPGGLVSPEEWNEWRVMDIDAPESANVPIDLHGRLTTPGVEGSVAEIASHFVRVLLDQRGFVDVLAKRENTSVLDVSCVGCLTPQASGQILDYARSKGLASYSGGVRAAGLGDLPSKLGLVRRELIGFAAASERNISLATLREFLLAIERAKGVVAELSWTVSRAHSQFVSEGHMEFGFRDPASADRFTARMLDWKREFSKQNWQLWVKE